MTTKWCPRCRREIHSPPTNPTSIYAKFWRDNLCYICDSQLHPPKEPSQSATLTATVKTVNLPAEPKSAPTPAEQFPHSAVDAPVATSNQIESERILDNGPQAAALRQLVRSALEKQGWLKSADLQDPKNREANLRWHAEQVDLVALEAIRAFAGRDWESNIADDRFYEFIDLALMNRQSNRHHSFANSAELFLSGRRGSEYRAGYQAQPARDKSAYTQPSEVDVPTSPVLRHAHNGMWMLAGITSRLAYVGMVLTSLVDGLLKLSSKFSWESVPHWPIIRAYDPARYESYIGLTGGWSPFGSWHNAVVFGVPFVIATAYSGWIQWAASRAIDKAGRSIAERLLWIRPWGRFYFVTLYVATLGALVAVWSPEIFPSPDVVAQPAQLALCACLATLAAHENSTILTGDLIRDVATASWT